MKSFVSLAFLWAVVLPLPVAAEKKHPDCTGGDRWPAAMALGYLKSSAPDLQAIENVIDYNHIKVERLSSVKTGVYTGTPKMADPTKYRQIHHVTFYKKTGEVLFEAITDNIAYQSECSGEALKIYEIAHIFPFPD